MLEAATSLLIILTSARIANGVAETCGDYNDVIIILDFPIFDEMNYSNS
jgi:hypothetical protein